MFFCSSGMSQYINANVTFESIDKEIANSVEKDFKLQANNISKEFNIANPEYAAVFIPEIFKIESGYLTCILFSIYFATDFLFSF